MVEDRELPRLVIDTNVLLEARDETVEQRWNEVERALRGKYKMFIPYAVFEELGAIKHRCGGGG